MQNYSKKKNKWNIYSKHHSEHHNDDDVGTLSSYSSMAYFCFTAYHVIFKDCKSCTSIYSISLFPLPTTKAGYLEIGPMFMSSKMQFYCDHWISILPFPKANTNKHLKNHEK